MPNLHLDIRDLTVCYGPVTALQGVDIQVEANAVVFMSGPNGAGKSTLLRAIAGILRPVSGSISLNSTGIGGLSPEKIVQRGLMLVPEGRGVFAELTVLENLRLGAFRRTDRKDIDKDIGSLLDAFPELQEVLHKPAGLLSGGQQQMLAISRALVSNAEFIAIDEPSLGLAPKVTERIYQALFKLQKEKGFTLLIAEQSISRAVQSNSEVILLRGGEVVRKGKAKNLVEEKEFNNYYFGI